MRFIIAASLASATLATSAHSAIIAFTNKTVWDIYTANAGLVQFAENFNTYSGFYPTPLDGSIGGVNWSASAVGGLFLGPVAGSTALSTNVPADLVIDLSGTSVFGFGGNIYGTDFDLVPVPTAIKVTLGDGTSYTNVVSSSTTFLGFFSSSGPISSISISALPAPGTSGNVYPTLDNMTFAVVPAPSVIALFSIAGACGRRRRA